MRIRPYLVVAALAGVGLAVVYQFMPARPEATSPGALPEKLEYFAEHDSDCNQRLLKLARSESGPFERVVPVGAQRPDERLRRHAWENGRFMVQGHLTGQKRTIAGCGTWPEFEVLSFRPWGRVQRCASPGAADASMLLYTDDLPEERYAPEDFVDGPWPSLIDDESCRLSEACTNDERHVKACTGRMWCCRLMPENKEPAPR
jgi:hypothetical protein